ncbi:large ribosomal subunit protein eL8y-like [Silene latifolia]|uniref:large ribosomal subunit protein eL8y-like n=1 Tax=Silene latifolia TaxID=37657 RepID=UPI003D78A8EA
MVVIAHVDPIELVTWLAALYCKMDCKARLGMVVLKKKRLCPTAVKNKDKMEFSRNVEAGKFVQKKTKDKDKMEFSIIRVEACNIQEEDGRSCIVPYICEEQKQGED